MTHRNDTSTCYKLHSFPAHTNASHATDTQTSGRQLDGSSVHSDISLIRLAELLHRRRFETHPSSGFRGFPVVPKPGGRRCRGAVNSPEKMKGKNSDGWATVQRICCWCSCGRFIQTGGYFHMKLHRSQWKRCFAPHPGLAGRLAGGRAAVTCGKRCSSHQDQAKISRTRTA